MLDGAKGKGNKQEYQITYNLEGTKNTVQGLRSELPPRVFEARPARPRQLYTQNQPVTKRVLADKPGFDKISVLLYNTSTIK